MNSTLSCFSSKVVAVFSSFNSEIPSPLPTHTPLSPPPRPHPPHRTTLKQKTDAHNPESFCRRQSTVRQDFVFVSRGFSLHRTLRSQGTFQLLLLLKCSYTSTETVGILGTGTQSTQRTQGTQDVHLDFHTAPELCTPQMDRRCSICPVRLP